MADHNGGDPGRFTEEWAERKAKDFQRRPVRTLAKLFAGALVLLGVVMLISSVFFGTAGFIGSWFGAGKAIVSPANVKEQHRAVIEEWEAMRTAAINSCNAENAANVDATLIEDPAFAYKAQYERITISYNRRQQNLFEAELVGPKGYPDRAPPLRAMQARFCE